MGQAHPLFDGSNLPPELGDLITSVADRVEVVARLYPDCWLLELYGGFEQGAVEVIHFFQGLFAPVGSTKEDWSTLDGQLDFWTRYGAALDNVISGQDAWAAEWEAQTLLEVVRYRP